ncbi:ABC transporter ATP-binding protein [Pollutibacter soli]|uniref:ABC transporter ATP-binding protein n=1 Tax=Pollutibacter soli TaxID=3034157 RepID=UPI00301396A7
MKISTTDAGKRFNRDWIFRHFSYHFQEKGRYAITGHNGSGKSTLLQVISGAILLSEGKCRYEINGKAIEPENQFRHVSICAPYLELIEEMNAYEFLDFHSTFKPLQSGISKKDILSIVGLGNTAKKQIRFFSSGMKQRLKLAQAVFSESPVLLLDEPCTNLDKSGIELYLSLIQNYCAGKIIIVSSNDETEYQFCQEIISIQDYK